MNLSDINYKKADIKDFEKLKLLGDGSSCKVYLVKHHRTQFSYAMKIIKKTTMRHINLQTITEQQILMEMIHPFISTLFFSFQTELCAYIVMQYSMNTDLFNIMQVLPLRCMKEEHVLFYASCVLSGLEYLHLNGIIHRDLKLENILVNESGHIALSDFDLSIHAKNTVVKKVFTMPYSRTNGIVYEPTIIMYGVSGTPEYMAPEVVNDKPYTCVIDWWTFGILIYEMAYGVTPFGNGEQRNEDCELIYESIRTNQLAFPITPFGLELSGNLKKLIKKLLIKNDKKRFGYNGGSTEIKDHPFFANVNFQSLIYQIPPIIPTDHDFDIPNLCDDSPDDTSEMVNESLLLDENIWKSFINVNRENINPDNIFSINI